jgi:hypothetical protein
MRGSVPAMEEVLSKSLKSETPLQEQEFVTLSLLDSITEFGTLYSVRQAHGQWSEIDRQVMWDNEETENFWTLMAAQKRYAEWRHILHESGYIYSDMDLF